MIGCRHHQHPARCQKCRRHAEAMSRIGVESDGERAPAPPLSPVYVERATRPDDQVGGARRGEVAK